jgi:hypothetical protein
MPKNDTTPRRRARKPQPANSNKAGATPAEAALELFDLAETDAIRGDESDYIGSLISELFNDTQALNRYERRAFKDALRQAETWESPSPNFAELCEVARRVSAGEDVTDVLRDRIAADKKNQAAFAAQRDGVQAELVITVTEIVAAAFPDEEARRDATSGIWKNGSVTDAAYELAEELNITILHPDVFPAVVAVILRDAPPVAAERVRDCRKWLAEHKGSARPFGDPRPWMVRPALRLLFGRTAKRKAAQ